MGLSPPLMETDINNTKVRYRPFLVKEEKVLIIALESKNSSDITNAVTEVLKKCILTKGINVDQLPTFDPESIKSSLLDVSPIKLSPSIL